MSRNNRIAPNNNFPQAESGLTTDNRRDLFLAKNQESLKNPIKASVAKPSLFKRAMKFLSAPFTKKSDKVEIFSDDDSNKLPAYKNSSESKLPSYEQALLEGVQPNIAPEAPPTYKLAWGEAGGESQTDEAPPSYDSISHISAAELVKQHQASDKIAAQIPTVKQSGLSEKHIAQLQDIAKLQAFADQALADSHLSYFNSVGITKAGVAKSNVDGIGDFYQITTSPNAELKEKNYRNFIVTKFGGIYSVEENGLVQQNSDEAKALIRAETSYVAKNYLKEIGSSKMELLDDKFIKEAQDLEHHGIAVNKNKNGDVDIAVKGEKHTLLFTLSDKVNDGVKTFTIEKRAFDDQLNSIEGQTDANILIAPSQYSQVMRDIKAAAEVAKSNEKSPFKVTDFGKEIKTFYNREDYERDNKKPSSSPSSSSATLSGTIPRKSAIRV